MEYLFRHNSSLDHYTAQAFTLCCFDDRFWKVFKNFLKSQGLTRIDPESVAGGAKILASPEKESDREFMLREIEKSIKLHGTKRIMLFTHYDCGAYGGLARFNGSEEEQLIFHQEELRKATAAFRGRFPDIAVETYFIDKEGIVQVVQIE